MMPADLLTYAKPIPVSSSSTPAAGRARSSGGPPRTLAALTPGERGVVSGFSDRDRPNPISSRMMEMGLTVGATVEVAHEAPFGGALAVRCRGTLLAVRIADARVVELERASAGRAP